MSERPVGRPTKYKPEYCDLLIEHMTQGLSFQSFAGVVGCCIETLYEWERSYPDFLDAKRLGLGRGRLFWEKVGIEAALGKITGYNATTWVFNMKNRFDWTDKRELSGKLETSVVSAEDISKLLDKDK